MTGQPLKVVNVDSGTRTTVSNYAGKPLYLKDGKNQKTVYLYDALLRPITTTLTSGSTTKTVEKFFYGEGIASDKAKNLRGKLYKHYQQSGSVEVSYYSFKGEPKQQITP
ncbi:MAG: hypothetical protein JXR48_11105 [Candidatus Delongbacteria bacterium]|nr:hypothetical protein [Candidatus Delongbacteria bacterium]